MNKYISDKERKHVVRLGAVMNTRDEAVADYSLTKNPDKEFIKAIKMMGSFAERALKIRMGYLEPQSQAKLMSDAQKNTIAVQWKDGAQKEYKALLALDSVTPVDTDDLFNIVELTVAGWCQKCNGEVAVCELRSIFVKYDIPIRPENAEMEGCPFRYHAP